jgi:hypothetical protein
MNKGLERHGATGKYARKWKEEKRYCPT